MVQAPKKQFGRLIKKGSPILGKLNVQPYDMTRICEVDVLHSDNPGGNIFHSDLHVPDDMDKGIKEFQGFKNDLIEPDQRPEVQNPKNFTDDWIRNKNRARKRSAMFDDDEFFDEEFMDREFVDDTGESAEGGSGENEGDAGSAGASGVPTPSDAGGDTSPNQDGSNTTVDVGSSEEKLRGLQDSAVDDSLRVVGEAIREMGSTALTSMEGEDVARQSDIDGLVHSNETAEAEEEFVATPTSGIADGELIEDRAVEQYQSQATAKSVDVESITQEARAKGYEEGFRSGEEKAVLQYRQKINEMFDKVSQLVSEFSTLRDEVVGNSQDVVRTLVEEIAQSVIGREVRLNPDQFGAIIRRAASEAVDGDAFKIFVSASAQETLGNIDLKGKNYEVEVDPELAELEFRVESSLGGVSASVQSIVEDLLEQVDIDLFESTEKTG